MFKQHFANMEFTGLAIFALLFFVLLFITVGVRVFFFKKPRDFERDASLPLID